MSSTFQQPQRPEPLPSRGATTAPALRFTIPTGGTGAGPALTDTAGTLAHARSPPTWDFKSWGHALLTARSLWVTRKPSPRPCL